MCGVAFCRRRIFLCICFPSLLIRRRAFFHTLMALTHQHPFIWVIHLRNSVICSLTECAYQRTQFKRYLYYFETTMKRRNFVQIKRGHGEKEKRQSIRANLFLWNLFLVSFALHASTNSFYITLIDNYTMRKIDFPLEEIWFSQRALNLRPIDFNEQKICITNKFCCYCFVLSGLFVILVLIVSEFRPLTKCSRFNVLETQHGWGKICTALSQHWSSMIGPLELLHCYRIAAASHPPEKKFF